MENEYCINLQPCTNGEEWGGVLDHGLTASNIDGLYLVTSSFMFIHCFLYHVFNKFFQCIINLLIDILVTH